MQFSPQQITMARELRRLGLSWEPRPGHYVFDETGFCRKGSPFQDGVYFILNYDYFINQAGGVERFKEIMLWLPTWHDSRNILQSFDVSDQEVAVELRERRAIEDERELVVLYELIAEELRHSTRSVHPDTASSLYSMVDSRG